MTTDRRAVIKAGRRAVRKGLVPLFTVHLESGTVREMPWLDFHGRRPDELAEAARRAIAAELGVRASQVMVELTDEQPDVTSITPPESDGQLYGG